MSVTNDDDVKFPLRNLRQIWGHDVDGYGGRMAIGDLATALGLGSGAPLAAYMLALRASQAGNGNPADQSGNMRDPAINTALFPPVAQRATAYTLGQYRAPAEQNGLLHKCTTAGTTDASEPTWASVEGGTTADGTVVWTAEKGPWGNSLSGYRHIQTLSSVSIGANGALSFPAIDWDMAAGDSLIIHMKMAWDAVDDSRADATGTIHGNRHATTDRSGFVVLSDAGSIKGLRLGVSDGVNTVVSGQTSASFSRKPLDGTPRSTLFAVDGQTKTMFGWQDAIAYQQSDMYDANNKSPHNLDVSAVTGSTATANNFMLGGLPGNAVTYDFGLIGFDLIVLNGRGLPADMQAVATWFAGTSALLPAGLLL